MRIKDKDLPYRDKINESMLILWYYVIYGQALQIFGGGKVQFSTPLQISVIKWISIYIIIYSLIKLFRNLNKQKANMLLCVFCYFLMFNGNVVHFCGRLPYQTFRNLVKKTICFVFQVKYKHAIFAGLIK